LPKSTATDTKEGFIVTRSPETSALLGTVAEPVDPQEETDRIEQQMRRVEPLLEEIAASNAAPSRTIVVMPAYNAAATLKKTVADIPKNTVDEIVLVDDASSDDTVEIAEDMGLTVIQHARNRGYGANQKTCYNYALERGADYVVMVHPDYQYDSRVVDVAVKILRLGICDCVLGSRIRTRRETLDGGMPLYKYVANRFLTTVENIALGQNLGDFHSGFRAYSRKVLETIPFERNSDAFVFDSQFLAQTVQFGFRLGDIPVPVRYFDEASSINFRRSARYGLSTLAVLVQFWAGRFGFDPARLFQSQN
jgi:glycosyltransferase involved in cell wall biosynthesis